MAKFYKVRLKCDNCGQFTAVNIPWGIKVEEYLFNNPNKICPLCGCCTFGVTWISCVENEALDKAKELLEIR